jgi:hypothetical protein
VAGNIGVSLTGWDAERIRGPGAIPVTGINGVHNPQDIQNLTPVISTQVGTFFRDIAPGAATVSGAKHPKTSTKIRISKKEPFLKFLY